ARGDGAEAETRFLGARLAPAAATGAETRAPAALAPAAAGRVLGAEPAWGDGDGCTTVGLTYTVWTRGVTGM
ncbi:MAG TPA: hypothetical protein DD990_38915, partial [Cyanobacteria bacterium UBA11368]|nr:hypothetical protein [Cyanobacteria bacterium UBA11368]